LSLRLLIPSDHYGSICGHFSTLGLLQCVYYICSSWCHSWGH